MSGLPCWHVFCYAWNDFNHSMYVLQGRDVFFCVWSKFNILVYTMWLGDLLVNPGT